MTSNANQPADGPAPGVYTFSCGNADAHAIITPNGTVGLVDADRAQVVAGLNALFGRTNNATDTVTIDFLWTTHGHQDHVAGLQKLKDAGYSIEQAYQPTPARFDIDVNEGVNSDVLERYYASLAQHGIEPEDIKAVTMGDEILEDKEISLTAISPPATSDTIEFDHPITGEPCTYDTERANPNSAACRYDGPHNSYLFMGDIENKPNHAAEAWLITQHQEGEIDLDADVMLFAHHGAEDAGNQPLLRTVDQDWTVISANGNKHPTTETLKDLQTATDSDLAVTDMHGRMAFIDGAPTPVNTNESTEPWRIDQVIHRSDWTDILAKKLTEKDEQIEEKDEEIKQKETAIDALEAENEQKDEQIAQKDERIAALLAESKKSFMTRAWRRLPSVLGGTKAAPDSPATDPTDADATADTDDQAPNQDGLSIDNIDAPDTITMPWETAVQSAERGTTRVRASDEKEHDDRTDDDTPGGTPR